MKKIEQILEGKSTEEIIKWFKRRMAYEVGRARNLGRVEALLDEGYTPLQIANKLDIPESRARRYVHDVDKIRKR